MNEKYDNKPWADFLTKSTQHLQSNTLNKKLVLNRDLASETSAATFEHYQLSDRLIEMRNVMVEKRFH
jgi:hypothetical protein